MASKALTEKHIPLNDQQGPPTQGASCLKTAKPPAPKCPSSKLPLSAQPSRKLQPAQGASFTTGQRGHPPRNCLGQYNRGRTPSLLAMPSGTLTPYSSDHMNLRRTEITRLYARLYAAGPMLQLLLALGSGHDHGRLAASAAAAAAALPPAAGRPRGAGPRAGTGLRALLRGDFGCSSRNSRTYFPS